MFEGGVAPSQTLRRPARPGRPAPVFTIAAPNGSFFVRIRALGPGGPSGTSNEVPLHVGVPVAPSAPAGFQATVSGSSLHLGWTPTFGGGVASGAMLDVTGTLAGTVPLAAGERISLAGVPPGNYRLRLRSVNAGGSSVATAPVDIAVPGACAAAPDAPANLLAYVAAGVTNLLWDPPAAGEAPLSYQLAVSGFGVSRWLRGRSRVRCLGATTPSRCGAWAPVASARRPSRC